VQPLHCGVSFATARETWLAPDLAARLSRTAGVASFADPFGHKMYVSPFDSNAPVPIMATRDGDSPSFNEASKGIDWIPWEGAMIKEIDSLNRSGTIAELVPEDSLPTWSASVLRNNLLPLRYPVCGLWLFQVAGQFGRSFRPPAEFGLGARY